MRNKEVGPKYYLSSGGSAAGNPKPHGTRHIQKHPDLLILMIIYSLWAFVQQIHHNFE